MAINILFIIYIYGAFAFTLIVRETSALRMTDNRRLVSDMLACKEVYRSQSENSVQNDLYAHDFLHTVQYVGIYCG